jgi:CRISPR/Cas system-associated exonuclease Cas4 (RecB family)
MTTTGLSRLTATRLSTLRQCPRQHYYRYEIGLSRIKDAAALRLGSAFHAGLDARSKGASVENAIAKATAGYERVPEWTDATEWAVEFETVKQLLAGHFWRYEKDTVEIIASELVFEIPLVNPDTGKRSRTFCLAGKLDAIAELADQRVAVLEYKTCGEDIGPDSDYWLRLRCDLQISQYVLAARAIGYDIGTVLYDVTRKPTIRLRKEETPEEFGERLLTDIGDRPDYYFQRREVPRLEDDLIEFQSELWQQATQLIESRKRSRWFRNVNRMTCSNCQFSELCFQRIQVNPDAPPAGYVILADVHPELSTKGA